MEKPRGLFVGLCTVDVQYQIDHFPMPNTKLAADHFAMQPGGPAYNAAVAFAFLGGDATVVSVVGKSSLAQIVKDDAKTYGVSLIDAAPTATEINVSSILTEAANGNRTIVYKIADHDGLQPLEVEGEFDTILVDGFYRELALPVLRRRAGQATVVMDVGSWNDQLQEFLRLVDVAICSEAFAPPGTDSRESALRRLRELGPSGGAITRGERPILWFDEEAQGETAVPRVESVDTLAAGDIFHGAFCFYSAAREPFTAALEKASKVAATSCRHFGTRTWMETADAQALKQR